MGENRQDSSASFKRIFIRNLNLYVRLIFCLIIIVTLSIETIPISEDRSLITTVTNITKSTSASSSRRGTIAPGSCTASIGCTRTTRNDTVVTETKITYHQEPAKVKNTSKNKNKIELTNFFAVQADDYPEESISRALSKTSDTVKKFFNIYNTSEDPHVNLSERVASKSASDYESFDGNYLEGREEPICRSIIQRIVPQASWLNGRRVFIANDREFMQVVEAELCANVNAECNHLEGILPEGMTSTCVQKYANKRLLYFEPNNEKLAADAFKYPSCCSCHIKHKHYDMRSLTPNTQHHQSHQDLSSASNHLNNPTITSVSSTTTNITQSFNLDSHQPTPNTIIINKRLDSNSDT